VLLDPRLNRSPTPLRAPWQRFNSRSERSEQECADHIQIPPSISSQLTTSTHPLSPFDALLTLELLGNAQLLGRRLDRVLVSFPSGKPLARLSVLGRSPALAVSSEQRRQSLRRAPTSSRTNPSAV
jgi:hypothetical protein